MSAGIPSGKHWHKKKHSQDGNFVLFKKKKKHRKKLIPILHNLFQKIEIEETIP